jgi:hypothetical protein
VNRYLQRLVTRGVGDPGSAQVLPSVRSTSPIAEEDQRVGMPGFEGFQFGAAASVEGASEDPFALSGDHRSEIPSPTIGVDNAGAGTVQRKGVGLGRTSGLATPGSAPAGTPVIVDRGRAGEAPTPVHLSEQPPAPRVRLDDAVIGPHNRVTGVRQAGRSNSTASQRTRDAGVPADWSAGEPAAPTPPFSAETETPRPPPRRSAEAGPPLLQPSPRAITLAQHRDAISSDAVESAGRPDQDQGPRVIIGRINVEVVPPPAEPKTSTASRPGPLTAASVSVIGPLTGGIRSNLRLSLRHR